MTKGAKPDRLTVGAVAAGMLAVGCCASLPVAVGVIASIGGVALGSIVAVALLVVLGGFALVRRRRRACSPSSSRGVAR